jgi:hypothetical protein
MECGERRMIRRMGEGSYLEDRGARGKEELAEEVGVGCPSKLDSIRNNRNWNRN